MGNRVCVVLPKFVNDEVEKLVTELEKAGKDLNFVYPTSNTQEIKRCIDVSGEIRIYYCSEVIMLEDLLEYARTQNKPMLLLNKARCEELNTNKNSFINKLLLWDDLSSDKNKKFSYKEYRDYIR